MMILIGNGKGADVYKSARMPKIEIQEVKVPYQRQTVKWVARRGAAHPWEGDYVYGTETAYRTKRTINVTGAELKGSVSAYKLRSLLGLSLTMGTPMKVSQKAVKTILEAI